MRSAGFAPQFVPFASKPVQRYHKAACADGSSACSNPLREPTRLTGGIKYADNQQHDASQYSA